MTHAWDPHTYLRYAGERARPFLDLVARVDVPAPRRVVDLGCGPGNLTAVLGQRWPRAEIVGIDSSVPMLEAARRDHGLGERVRFELGDLHAWPGSRWAPADVVVSNAALQWVPGHLDLLPRIVEALTPEGVLAVQVPGNFGEPSHTIRAELAAQPRYAAYLEGVAVPQSHDPTTYLQRLAELGCAVDAWETTYLHVLTGPDPVFAWVCGTGARPTLQALPEGPVRDGFVGEYKERLRAAYPDGPAGVVLPFRRVFVVARRLPER